MNSVVTFRLDTKKKAALDAIAANQERDRSYVLKEAIEAYLDVQQWQVAYIKKALKEADAGDFATDKDVKKAFAKCHS